MSPGDAEMATGLVELDALRNDVARLELRVTELQADGSRLQNELRMWRARADATKRVLALFALEQPISMAMRHLGVPEEMRPKEAIELQRRIESLEKDAWCGAAAMAREFIKSAESIAGAAEHVLAKEPGCTSVIDPATLREWAQLFREIVGDP